MPAQLLNQNKKEEKKEVLEVESACLVFKTLDGLFGVTTNINIPLVAEKTPTQSEIKSMLHALLDTINNQEVAVMSAQQVLSMQVQMGQKMAEAQANQEILSKLHTGSK